MAIFLLKMGQNQEQLHLDTYLITVFPHIRPTGIIILYSFQMRVLLENTTFLLHKIVRIVELLELRVLFKGGPYMRKYDNSRTATSYLSSPLLAQEGQIMPTTLLLTNQDLKIQQHLCAVQPSLLLFETPSRLHLSKTFNEIETP